MCLDMMLSFLLQSTYAHGQNTLWPCLLYEVCNVLTIKSWSSCAQDPLPCIIKSSSLRQYCNLPMKPPGHPPWPESDFCLMVILLLPFPMTLLCLLALLLPVSSDSIFPSPQHLRIALNKEANKPHIDSHILICSLWHPQPTVSPLLHGKTFPH